MAFCKVGGQVEATPGVRQLPLNPDPLPSKRYDFFSFNNLTASFNYQNLCSWLKTLQVAHKIPMKSQSPSRWAVGSGTWCAVTSKGRHPGLFLPLYFCLSAVSSLTNRSLEITPQELPQDTSVSLLNFAEMESSSTAPRWVSHALV